MMANSCALLLSSEVQKTDWNKYNPSLSQQDMEGISIEHFMRDTSRRFRPYSLPHPTPLREQILEAEIVRYAEEVRSLQVQLAEKTHLAEMGALTAMIVHEIRNPLTTIWMWLNYCQKQKLSEPALERLSLALEEGDRLQRLLNQILAYSKPRVLQMSKLDLNQLVIQTLESLRRVPLIQERKLEFCPADQAVTILGDPDKLKQVLINLVINACEAVNATELIRLSIDSSLYNCVYLRVWNGGIPIPIEVLPKLTKSFYTTKANGTGLGLAIVKQIIESHQGELVIESSQTSGTTVTVILPSNLKSDGAAS